KHVRTIVVEELYAAAGYIDVRADVLNGAGELNAPSDVKVSIVNETANFLEIEGISIPKDNGGVTLNGFLNPITNAQDANTINTASKTADNGDNNRAGEGPLTASNASFTVVLSAPGASTPKPTILVKNAIADITE